MSINANEKSYYLSMSVSVCFTGKNRSKFVFLISNYSPITYLNFHSDVYLGNEIFFLIFFPFKNTTRSTFEDSKMLIDFIRPLTYSKNILSEK